MDERDYDLLSAYLDDELSATARAELEARLLVERDLRAELDALQGVVALIKQLPERPAPRNYRLTAEQVATTPPNVIPLTVARRAPRAGIRIAIGLAASMIIAFVALSSVLPNLFSSINGTLSNEGAGVASLPTMTMSAQSIPTDTLEATLLDVIETPAFAIQATADETTNGMFDSQPVQDVTPSDGASMKGSGVPEMPTEDASPMTFMLPPDGTVVGGGSASEMPTDDPSAMTFMMLPEETVTNEESADASDTGRSMQPMPTLEATADEALRMMPAMATDEVSENEAQDTMMMQSMPPSPLNPSVVQGLAVSLLTALWWIIQGR